MVNLIRTITKINVSSSYKGNTTELSVCSFIAFKTKLEVTNIEEIIMSEAMYRHIEIISLCNLDRILALTVDELIEFRNLL